MTQALAQWLWVGNIGRGQGMVDYQFTRALAYDFGALASMFTEAFSGYFFPMNLSAAALANHFRLYHIDAARSLVMLDRDGVFAGLALVGVRGTRGWCGGFGVAPAFRGRGAGKRLAHEMVECARASGLSSLQLEVLSQNDAARATYEAAGLTVRRHVRTLELAVEALPDGMDESAGPVTTEAALTADDMLAAQPVWQQETASLLAMTTETAHISDSARQRSSLVYARAGEKARILAAHVTASIAERELVALLRRAAGESAVIQLVNCPESNAIMARCQRLGFTEIYSQDEMYLAL